MLYLTNNMNLNRPREKWPPRRGSVVRSAATALIASLLSSVPSPTKTNESAKPPYSLLNVGSKITHTIEERARINTEETKKGMIKILEWDLLELATKISNKNKGITQKGPSIRTTITFLSDKYLGFDRILKQRGSKFSIHKFFLDAMKREPYREYASGILLDV